MPRNANTGVYTPPANSWNPAQPDTVISSADWNALQADMATALSHVPATTRALHPTTGQVQDGAFVWGGTAGGTADALTLTLTPAITSYVDGLAIRFRTGSAANATATPTLSVNGLAAHTITNADGTPIAAGDLPANSVVEVVYSNSAWRLSVLPRLTTWQLQNGSFVWGGTAGGTADALTLTLTPPITAYAEGLTVRFRVGPATNNTTTPTLAINGLTAHTITKYDGASLAAGDLPANSVVEVVYNNGAWRLMITPQSQVQGNDGSTAVTSATSVNLTSTSSRVQVVSITTEGKSVFLPDARALTIGGPRFYVRNAGAKTFALRPSNANQAENGGFDTNSVWVLGDGWAISGGVATKTSGSATDIEQALSTTSGVAYQVTFTITSVSGGSVRVVLKGGGPDVLGTPRSAAGTYTETLISNGNTTLALRADASFAGSIDNVSLTLKNPPLLAGMPPGAIAECVLENNDTIQGKWHIIGRNTMAAFPVVNTILPSSLTQPFAPGVQTLKMSETISLHFARNASGHPFVFALDHDSDPPVIGTPVLISAVNTSVKQAFRLGDNKAFVVLDRTTDNCFIVSVSGTTCSVSASATASVFSQGTHWRRPLTATLGANNDLFVAIDSSNNPNIRAQAVNASGNVPDVGSPVNISTTGVSAAFSAVSIFRVDDERAVAFYVDNSGVSGSPFSIRAVVLTLTGTSIQVGTSAGVNDVINNVAESHGAICQVSNTSYVWVYGSDNNVQAVAITVSGSSVTFGTPITVTTFQNSQNMQVNFDDLGTCFNPAIFSLSNNRIFSAFRKESPDEWRCVILTVNGLSLSAGSILSLRDQSRIVFFRYNNEHTVLVSQSAIPRGYTGGIIGLDHEATSIVPSGSVLPLGAPHSSFEPSASMANGIMCIRYNIVGSGSTPAPFSSRMEVFAGNPNGVPTLLGNFTLPEIRWEDIFFPIEVSSRRLALLGRTVAQEGTDARVKLCIMEVVS